MVTFKPAHLGLSCLVGLTGLVLAACVRSVVPAMHPATAASLARQPQPTDATVVFVRPASSCDTDTYAIIVDENGHFVANADRNTTTSVTVPAGRHAFYVWGNGGVLSQKYPEYDPVGAIAVNASPGAVARIGVVIPKIRALICGAPFVFMAENGDGLGKAEMDEWIRDATPVEPEPLAGERELAQDPLTSAHLESGRRHLREQLAPVVAKLDPAEL